jgi:hypothetical protein
LPRLSLPGAEYLRLKRHFLRAENTYGWIQQDTVLAEALKLYAGVARAHPTQVLLVLILRGRGDQHVIYICVTEVQVLEYLMDEPLKCLRGISETK